MILGDAFLAVTHMVTQLAGRWIPPGAAATDCSLVETVAYKKIAIGLEWHTLSEEDWEDLIHIDLVSPYSVLPWLPNLLIRVPTLLPTLTSALVRHFQLMKAAGGHPLFISSDLYPERLRNIARPPLMLSYLGDPRMLALPAVAVIGSRQASYFGLQQSYNIGKKLCDLPVTVVSGGAIGCDIAVHQGMLSRDIKSIRACIVFAGGLERLYPRRHGAIFDQVLQRGGLFLSEKPWHQASLKHDFPIRNRIVSGMSESVVVTQAATQSGSLITANEALEQGRDVYVLRHKTGDIRAAGSEKLLEDGATGFTDIDVLLGYLVGSPQNGQNLWDFNNNADTACQQARIIDTVEEEQHII